MHSATKYMNGHSDVIMGLLTCKKEWIKKKLEFVQYAVGAVPSPFDCFLGSVLYLSKANILILL